MPIILPASSTWAPTPANTKLESLKRRIANYCLFGDDPDALNEANEAIRSAVRKLNSRLWDWSKKSQDITLTGSTGTYAVNAAFKAPRNCFKLDSSDLPKGRIFWEDPKILDTIDTVRRTEGTPRHYTFENYHEDGLLTLLPTPNSAFVTENPKIRLKYYARVQMPQGGEKLDVPNEVEEFVLWYARAEMAAVHNQRKLDPAVGYWSDLWREIKRSDRHPVEGDWSEGRVWA